MEQSKHTFGSLRQTVDRATLRGERFPGGEHERFVSRLAQAQNRFAACALLEDHPIPSLRSMQRVREDVYGRLDPEAGVVRSGQSAASEYFHPADARRVDLEWALLREQAGELFAVAQAPEEKVGALAYVFAKAEAIAPFAGSNEVVNRALVAGLADNYLHPQAGLHVMTSLVAAYRSGAIKPAMAAARAAEFPDLAPLAAIIGQGVGVKLTHSSIRPPYVVACGLHEPGALAEELERSRTGELFFGREVGEVSSRQTMGL